MNRWIFYFLFFGLGIFLNGCQDEEYYGVEGTSYEDTLRDGGEVLKETLYVKATGITQSVEDYDDGYYQEGLISNFVGDQIIYDDISGLYWANETSAMGVRTYVESVQYCNLLSYGGYGDWRLPTIVELQGVVNYNSSSICKYTNFSGVKGEVYFSSTTANNLVWGVDFSSGESVKSTKSESHEVICVRERIDGEKAPSFFSDGEIAEDIVNEIPSVDDNESTNNDGEDNNSSNVDSSKFVLYEEIKEDLSIFNQNDGISVSEETGLDAPLEIKGKIYSSNSNGVMKTDIDYYGVALAQGSHTLIIREFDSSMNLIVSVLNALGEPLDTTAYSYIDEGSYSFSFDVAIEETYYVVVIDSTARSSESWDYSIKIFEDEEEMSSENEIPSSFEFKIITSSTTGKNWLDRNLGALHTCQSLDDESCFGDYYQWGRSKDGHEKPLSNTTIILDSSGGENIGFVNHNKFITSSASDLYDWNTEDVSGQIRQKNWNPCPAGFRVPTANEWNAEIRGFKNNSEAFLKLKLSSAGLRTSSYGSLVNQGVSGSYWSSSINSTNSQNLNFRSTSSVDTYGNRANGLSVRCIEE